LINWVFETIPRYHNSKINDLIQENNEDKDKLKRELENQMNQMKEYYNKEIAMLTESKNKMKESVVSFSMAVKKLKKDLTTSQEKNNELVEAEHK